MNAAPFRIVLWRTSKRPLLLARFVDVDCLDGAVLCAAQWLLWSNAAGRGKLAKYERYRVETRGEDGAWRETATGNRVDARSIWTDADDARVDALEMVRPLIGVQGTTRHDWSYTVRGGKKPKSRLTQLVERMQQKR